MKTQLTPRFTDEKLAKLLQSPAWCHMAYDTIRYEARARGFDEWAPGNGLNNDQWLRQYLAEAAAERQDKLDDLASDVEVCS